MSFLILSSVRLVAARPCNSFRSELPLVIELNFALFCVHLRRSCLHDLLFTGSAPIDIFSGHVLFSSATRLLSIPGMASLIVGSQNLLVLPGSSAVSCCDVAE